MASMLRLLTVLALCLVFTVKAQDDSNDAATSPFPGCAQSCIGTAMLGGLCAPDDLECICHDETFQQNVTMCIGGTCSIMESLVAKNASMTNCGAPVRDRSQEYVVVSNVMASIAALFVIIRFAYKIWNKLELGFDDWFVLATLVAILPSAVITVKGTTANGLGKDIWTLTPTQITDVIFWFYIMAVLYFTQSTLVKLTIIFFYKRIFPARDVQRLIWATVAFTALWGFTFIITAIFQCRPINYFWLKWDGLHEGSCADPNSFTWTHASINIALDLWILAIPLWQVRNLKLHWKKKVGVAVMFCVGTFVTIVSILRLQSLVHFAATSNTTWEFYDVSLWSSIEITVGIICACLPSIRMVLVKIFPALTGSSARSKGTHGYQKYGSGPSRTAGGGTKGRTVNTCTVERPASGGPPSDDGSDTAGIMFQKSYTVQFSDHDEASLVQMKDLDVPQKTYHH